MKRWMLLVACMTTAWAQSGSLGNGWVAKDGLRFAWDTRVEPAQPQLKTGGFGASSPGPDGWIAKTMIDRTARTFFGYEVLLSKTGEGVRVQFRPLNVTPKMTEQWHIEDPAAWKTLAVQVPAQQTLRTGDVIAIELMRNPSTGQKIVDYVSVQENEPATFATVDQGRPQFAFVGGEAHDFRIEDVELLVSRPRLTVTSRQGSTGYESEGWVSGTFFWFYIPGKGRYAMSVLPHPGFQRLGDIRGTVMRFAIGEETFTLSSAQRVLGGGPYNLYVRHEPSFRFGDTFQVGAQDFWN